MNVRRRSVGGEALAGFLALASAILLLAAAASAAPPGTKLFTPHDPGYVAMPAPWEYVDAPASWAVTRGKAYVIEVLDSGINRIPDLASHLGSGFNSSVAGGDSSDTSGHGTMVASVAAATIENGSGIAGLCGGCWVGAGKVTEPDGSLVPISVHDAIDIARVRGAKVILVSLPLGSQDSGLIQSITRLTVEEDNRVVIMMAGNDGKSEDVANYSAAISDRAIRVACVDLKGNLDPRSNYGPSVDIAAPCTMVADGLDGNPVQVSGTEYAAAQVAGAAGLLYAYNQNLSATDVKKILMGTGTSVPSLPVACHCVLNVYNALSNPQVGYVPPPPAKLTVSKSGDGQGKVRDNSTPQQISCGSYCSGVYVPGTTVTLSAEAGAQAAFTGWSGGACSGSSPTCTVTMKGVMSVTASFSKKYVVTVKKSGTGKGLVTSSPAGIKCGKGCSKAFPSGTEVTLTAKAFTESKFKGWSGACVGNKRTCSLKASGPLLVGSVFAREPKHTRR